MDSSANYHLTEDLRNLVHKTQEIDEIVIRNSNMIPLFGSFDEWLEN